MARLMLAGVFAAQLLAPVATRAGEGARVEVGHNHVAPAEVTIQAGDAVTFRNRDAMPGGHTIVATDGSFESPPLAQGESWTHRFAEPGTWRFRIKQHPEATGTVVVE